MVREKNEASNLMEELAEYALERRLLSSLKSHEVPGELVKSLSPEQRKILEGLKAEDIANTRWTRPDGINLEKMPYRRQ